MFESNRPAPGIRADAGQTLEPLDRDREPGYDAVGRVAETLGRVRARLDAQHLGKDRTFMQDIRDAVPADMRTSWDMTIAAYWARSCWGARDGQFHSAQGAGGLWFGFPVP